MRRTIGRRCVVLPDTVAGISGIVGVLIHLASTNVESEGALPCH